MVPIIGETNSTESGSQKPGRNIPVWQVVLLYVMGFLCAIAVVDVITHTWLHWLSAENARLLAAFLYIGVLTFFTERVKGVRWLPAATKSIAFAGCVGAIVWLTDRLFR